MTKTTTGATASAAGSSPGNRPRFLDGPITRQLLKLALPILIVLAVQTTVGVAETYFVSRMGTDAVAGVALVFPLLMLMTMMTAGGFGGGVASAIARAIGAGRQSDADALLVHTLVIAVVFGLLFTGAALFGGPTLYRAMGANGTSLANALTYSNLVFGISILIWVTNLLSAALRGAGNVRVPAILMTVSSAGTLVLSPLFIFGLGPVPGLGIAGAGVAMIFNYIVSTATLVAYVGTGSAPIRWVRTPIQWRLLKEIMGVGALSALGTVQANLTVIVTMGFVGYWGSAAIAGYGMESRLDYILIPLLFAIGTASVTMVGTNVGAGQHDRAFRIAMVAAGVSATVVEAIGILAAVFPRVWMRLFSDSAEVIEIGADYLVRVAPFYGLYGVGMALYFASQGAGRVLWPLIMGSGRLALIALGGWLSVHAFAGSPQGLFWLAAAGMSLFGILIGSAFLGGLILRNESRHSDDPRWMVQPSGLTLRPHIRSEWPHELME